MHTRGRGIPYVPFNPPLPLKLFGFSSKKTTYSFDLLQTLGAILYIVKWNWLARLVNWIFPPPWPLPGLKHAHLRLRRLRISEGSLTQFWALFVGVCQLCMSIDNQYLVTRSKTSSQLCCGCPTPSPITFACSTVYFIYVSTTPNVYAFKTLMTKWWHTM